MPSIKVLDQEGRWSTNNEDEFLWWPRVIWIDPGTVSGVAMIWFDPQALLVEGAKTAKVVLAFSELYLHGPENGLNGQVHRYLRLRNKLDEEIGLATGCESFVPLQLNQSHEFLAPVRIRAALDYELSKIRPRGASEIGNGVPLYVQSPVDAKSAFNNQRLQALRMYTEGPDHVNDAKRHGLLHIRRLKAGSPEERMARFREMHGYEEGWFS